MPKLGTKPALALGVTAAVVLGASGISAEARVTSNSTDGTTPTTVRGGHGPGGGLGADATALAKKLGISVDDLQAAVKAVRDSESKSDVDADRVSEAKTVADALGVSESTVQTVFDDQKPAGGDHRGGGPAGTTPSGTAPTTPPAGAPSGTTPPTGTTPPAGGPRGGHGGGPGRGAGDQTALIAALVKATGKDEAAVKAALTKADAVRDAARKEREAEFAKKLAAQLHLDQSKVAAAIVAARPTAPARNAKQSSAQTG
jgi:hypothetical protein